MTNIYEGTCKHCGQIQKVIANGQEEADTIAMTMCECGAGAIERRMETLQKTATDLTENMPEGIGEKLYELSLLSLKGVISSASINIEGIVFKVTLNTKGQVKISKKETKQAETLC